MLLLQGFVAAFVLFLLLKIAGWIMRRNREQDADRRYLRKLAWSSRPSRDRDPDLFFSNTDNASD
jgi:hypothetical protein